MGLGGILPLDQMGAAAKRCKQGFWHISLTPFRSPKTEWVKLNPSVFTSWIQVKYTQCSRLLMEVWVRIYKIKGDGESLWIKTSCPWLFLWGVIFGREMQCYPEFWGAGMRRTFVSWPDFSSLYPCADVPRFVQNGLFGIFFFKPIWTVIHIGSLTDLYHMDHFKASFR